MPSLSPGRAKQDPHGKNATWSTKQKPTPILIAEDTIEEEEDTMAPAAVFRSFLNAKTVDPSDVDTASAPQRASPEPDDENYASDFESYSGSEDDMNNELSPCVLSSPFKGPFRGPILEKWRGGIGKGGICLCIFWTSRSHAPTTARVGSPKHDDIHNECALLMLAYQ